MTSNFEAIIVESVELLQEEVDEVKTMPVDGNMSGNKIGKKEIDTKMDEIIAAIMNGVEIGDEQEKNINQGSNFETVKVAKERKKERDVSRENET